MVKIFVILFFLVANSITAQDLIVKRSGEVIYCNIESVEDYFIHFYELADTSKSLLYRMDAALVKKIAFAGEDEVSYEDQSTLRTSDSFFGKYNLIETNIDGLINDYISLHYQFLKPKYALDFGVKRYSAPSNLFVQSIDDSGSMVEMGISFPLKMFGSEERPLRGIYLRGFGLYASGNFQNSFQTFRIIEYSQLTFGAQAVMFYQVSRKFYIKAYYGLGGTIQVSNLSPIVRRADLAEGDGLQNIFGFRVGYIF